MKEDVSSIVKKNIELLNEVNMYKDNAEYFENWSNTLRDLYLSERKRKSKSIEILDKARKYIKDNENDRTISDSRYIYELSNIIRGEIDA